MDRKNLIFVMFIFMIASIGAVPFIMEENPDIQNENKIESIAEEAIVYGFPMIMAYDIMYKYTIDKNSGQYKAPFNQIHNESQVYTPKDTAVVTPNSDTPYSFLIMDLRAEPVILCVPKIDKNRYYSIQLTSLYTFNFGYIGSRATGNDAGCYAVVGPNWKGVTPAGIDKVFRSETEFAIAIYRTQLFNSDDMENVKKIQSQYKAQTLSQFTNTYAPAPASNIKWLKINKELAKANPFEYLNFILQFAPPVGAAAVEEPLRKQFAKIGIEAGKPFSMEEFKAEEKFRLEMGLKNGMVKIKHAVETLGKDENGWRISTKGFGDRADYKGDWTLRAAAAMAGIFGNDAVEALYPLCKVDGDSQVLDGSKYNYTLTFPSGQLPPVNAFWSVTMYDANSQLLIVNPINRYVINSAMLPNLKKNTDGSLTLYIQRDSPGKENESNWLPAPNGPIYLVMRLYWPKEEALKGQWKPPPVKRGEKAVL